MTSVPHPSAEAPGGDVRCSSAFRDFIQGGRRSPPRETERQIVIRYVNAEDILPPALVAQIRQYFPGGALYVPRLGGRAGWGESSGLRRELAERNARIRQEYRAGADVESLARDYCLSPDSIRKIVKQNASP